MRNLSCSNGGIKTKLLIIGFDALDYDMFRDFVPEGYELHRLYSPVPATPPGWISIYSGLSPEEHGYSESWTEFLDNYKTIRRPECFWKILNRRGYKVELLNLPCTYPPDKVTYYMIAGFPIPNFKTRDYVYPRELIEKLPADFIHHMDLIHWHPERPGVDWGNWVLGLGEKEFLRRIKEDNNVIIDTFYSLHKEDTDLAFVQFSFIDRVAHLTKRAPGHYSEETLMECFKMAKEIIMELDNHIKPESVIVISDHGLRLLREDETSDLVASYTHSENGAFCTKNIQCICKENKDISRCVISAFPTR